MSNRTENHEKEIARLQAERKKFTSIIDKLQAEQTRLQAALPDVYAQAERATTPNGNQKIAEQAEQEIAKLEKQLTRKQAALRSVDRDIVTAQESLLASQVKDEQTARDANDRRLKKLAGDRQKLAEQLEQVDGEMMQAWHDNQASLIRQAELVGDGQAPNFIREHNVSTCRRPDQAVLLLSESRKNTNAWQMKTMHSPLRDAKSLADVMFTDYVQPAIVPARRDLSRVRIGERVKV